MKKPGFILVIACIALSGCISINRGLEPVSPSYGLTWSAKVDTLTPRLEWSPYKNAAAKQDLRYQLQIVDGNVVRLFRDNILETCYVVDEPLEPNKKYQWRVRPVWTVNGKTEGENWNYKTYFFITPIIFGWGQGIYNLTTPEATK